MWNLDYNEWPGPDEKLVDLLISSVNPMISYTYRAPAVISSFGTPGKVMQNGDTLTFSVSDFTLT